MPGDFNSPDMPSSDFNGMDNGTMPDMNNGPMSSQGETQDQEFDDGQDDESFDFPSNDPEDGGQENDNDEEYENDFDPGVDANEEEDPEKYLQQLTGKLCDKLKKFNDEKPKPDAGMCKYIAGMVLAQCTKGLDEKQKDEILSKLTKGNDSDDDGHNDDEYNENDHEDNGNEQTDFDKNGMNSPEDENSQMNESRRIIERIVQNVTSDLTDKKPKAIGNKKIGYRTSPYLPPRFN